MRTDASNGADASLVRLRSRARRAWQWLAGLGFTIRVVLAAAMLGGLVAAGYWIAGPAETETTSWLYEERSLPVEQEERALAALAEAKIPATTGPSGQIAVASGRRAEALSLLEKKKLAPATINDLRTEFQNSPFWQGSDEREFRQQTLLMRTLEIKLEKLPEISSATVDINRGKGRPGSSSAGKVGAYIYLRPRDPGPLGPATIKKVQAIIKSSEPDLPDDALTILDEAGTPYRMAGNPAAGAELMAQAQQEELRRKIREQLAWIHGIRVFVTLEGLPAQPPTPTANANPDAEAPAIVINSPVALAENIAPPRTIDPPAPSKALILVQVPIAHYLTHFQGERQPSAEDLVPLVKKTEATIRSTIDYLLPSGLAVNVKVDRIDDAEAIPPPVNQAESKTLAVPPWSIPVAIGGCVSLVFLVVGTLWLMMRRPVAASESAPRRAEFAVGDAAGPAERVRELVRLDPAVSAGVLQRWIGQGGRAA